MAEKSQITIEDVANSLISLGERLAQKWSELGWAVNVNAHTLNWVSPSISIEGVTSELQLASDRVLTLNKSMSEEQRTFAGQLRIRADVLAVDNVASDPNAILLNVFELINSVFRHIPPIVPTPPKPKVDWENLKDEQSLLPKDLARRLRSIDARLNELEPRATGVEALIADIEAAHATAEQLPTDLADLNARKGELHQLVEEASKLSEAIATANTRSEDARLRIEAAEGETKVRIAAAHAAADTMIKRSEQALRGATSVGLANAFEARRAALTSTGYWWTVGLIIALGCALLVGWERVDSLKTILSGNSSASVIWANALLALIGIGAPVWFAWLSTKQIGTTFRLAEDYAFKASVSQAYEGYRAEAVEIDPVLRERLFATALSRIEEAPIRLIDGEAHSSPLSELLSRPGMKNALESIPGIADKIVALIPSKAGIAAAVVAPVAIAGTLADADQSASSDDTAKK
jgi:uncharacterized protein YoxC